MFPPPDYVLLSFLDIQGPRYSSVPILCICIPSSVMNAETTVHNVIFCSSHPHCGYVFPIFTRTYETDYKKIKWRNIYFVLFFILCTYSYNEIVISLFVRVHLLMSQMAVLVGYPIAINPPEFLFCFEGLLM